MWYAVNLLFEGCHAGQPPENNLWEERIMLFEGESADAVGVEASLYGKNEEHQYTNEAGEQIHWRFRGVDDVQAIDSAILESGTEVFSRFLRASEVASLRTPFSDDAGVPRSTKAA